MKKIILVSSALLFCSLIFSCGKNLPVESAGPHYDWTLFDSSLYVSQIEMLDESTMIYTGSSTHTCKVENGVKTFLNFGDNDYIPRCVRTLNSNCFAFLNWWDSYNRQSIKFFNNGILSTIKFNGEYTPVISDFLILNQDKLLIIGYDSIYYWENSAFRNIKISDGTKSYAAAKQNGKIYIYTKNYSGTLYNFYSLEGDSLHPVEQSSISYTPYSNKIQNKITRIRVQDETRYLDYFNGIYWVNFYRSQHKFYNGLAGADINNFYFASYENNKTSGYFYDGAETRTDENSPLLDSASGICNNTTGSTIYSFKGGSNGQTFIYRGRKIE